MFIFKIIILKEWISFNTIALFKLLIWQVADMNELKESFFQAITTENFFDYSTSFRQNLHVAQFRKLSKSFLVGVP